MDSRRWESTPDRVTDRLGARFVVAAPALAIALALVTAACGSGDREAGGATTTSTMEATTSTSVGDRPDAVDRSLALCLGATAPEASPAVESAEVVEASGLAASRDHDGVLWVHNDSGGAPALYAMTLDGTDLGTFALDGATARDWEDLAIGPGPDGTGSYLYAGDIGDNASRRDSIVVYRVGEPAVALPPAEPTEHLVAGVDALTLRYPDGAHDAEALLVDPVDGRLLVLTKAWAGETTGVYAAPLDLAAGSTTELVLEGTVDLADHGVLLTGGDISVDGGLILLRTYSAVLVWPRAAGTTVADALAGDPCEAPVVSEAQGEAVAILSDDTYVTVSEGALPPVHVYRVEATG